MTGSRSGRRRLRRTPEHDRRFRKKDWAAFHRLPSLVLRDGPSKVTKSQGSRAWPYAEHVIPHQSLGPGPAKVTLHGGLHTLGRQIHRQMREF
jgi:hypothetical protein